MLRILMVISEAPPVISGISRVAERLHNELRSLGHWVSIISLRDVPRLELGEVRLSSMLWKAGRILLPRLQDYDIIHIHGPAPTFSDIALLYSSILSSRNGPAIVYTHHSEIDLQGIRLICDIYNWTHKRLARLADQIIVTTPTYARDLANYIPPEYVSVVPWGVDGSSVIDEEHTKPGPVNVLFVGQLRPYKGIDVLLRAAEHLPNVPIDLVGGGHQQQHYRQLAAERNLQNVRFRGKMSDADLLDLFATSDILVLPSTTRAEAFGLVVLEGMAAGCVPIVSEIPGLADVVGDAGFSVPVGDDVALAAAIDRLRNDDQLRLEYSRRARRRAQQHSWQRTARWHQALYQRLLTLRRFRTELRTGVDHERGLHLLLEDAVSTMQADAGSIMLLEPQDAQLRLSASTNLPAEAVRGYVQPLGEGVAGYVALHNQPLLLPEGMSAHGEAMSSNALQRTHIHSALSVPIQGKGQPLGVINLSSYDTSRQFGSDELDWLVSFGRRTGNLISMTQRG